MRLSLLAAGVFVVLGACDGKSAAPLSEDSEAAADSADSDAGSPESDALDAAQLEATPVMDAAPVADTAPVADAAQLADAQRADAAPSWQLGMNDVTILTPVPAGVSSPVLLRGSDLGQDGAPFIPKDLFDRLEEDACFGALGYSVCEGEVELFAPSDYERLHLVAVRFDLCDRNLPGTCAEGEDGRLRMVWQPMRDNAGFADTGLHTFFSIPNAQLPDALATLRELAQLQGAPVTSQLAVSPGLSDPKKPEYAERLRAFVRTHAQRARLVRLTVNAQPAIFAEIRWLMRGLERRADGMFHEIVIPGSTAVQQDVFLRGTGFQTSPIVDLPPGLAGILPTSMFEAATSDAQTKMLEALLAVDHPLKVAPDTAPCVACHTSTPVLDARAPAGVDVWGIRGAYVSSHNITVETRASPGGAGRVRAFGYIGRTPVISRRVAHETAQVLSEIEQRFP